MLNKEITMLQQNLLPKAGRFITLIQQSATSKTLPSTTTMQNQKIVQHKAVRFGQAKILLSLQTTDNLSLAETILNHKVLKTIMLFG